MLNFILFLSAYLPFQIALNPSSGVDLASIRVLIIFAFLWWLADGLKKRKLIIKNNQVSFFVLFFVFSVFVSMSASRNIEWSVRKFAYFASIFPIYFVVSSTIREKREIERILKALVLGGFLASIVGIFQFSLQFFLGLDRAYELWGRLIGKLFLGSTFSKEILSNSSWLVGIGGKTYMRSISVFPDPHMFSFFLGMLIPSALGLAVVTKKPFYIGAFLFMLVADVLSFSRGAYIGLIAGSVFVSFIFLQKMKLWHKIMAGVMAFIVFLAMFYPGPISERFQSTFDFSEGSNIGRIEIWRKAADTFRENPFLGVGIGNFSLEVKPSADYRNSIYAHNAYLDVASETGILGLLAFCGLLAASFWKFLKARRDEPLFFWMAAGLLVFSVHSIFDTGLYSPSVLALFLIIISFAGAYEKTDRT